MHYMTELSELKSVEKCKTYYHVYLFYSHFFNYRNLNNLVMLHPPIIAASSDLSTFFFNFTGGPVAQNKIVLISYFFFLLPISCLFCPYLFLRLRSYLFLSCTSFSSFCFISVSSVLAIFCCAICVRTEVINLSPFILSTLHLCFSYPCFLESLR